MEKKGLPKELLEELKELGFTVIVDTISLGDMGDEKLKTVEKTAMAAKVEGLNAQRVAETDYLIRDIARYEKRLAKTERDRDEIKAIFKKSVSDLCDGLADTKGLLRDSEALLDRTNKERDSHRYELMAIHQVIGKPITSKTTKAELLEMIILANEILNGTVSK